METKDKTLIEKMSTQGFAIREYSDEEKKEYETLMEELNKKGTINYGDETEDKE